VVEGTELVRTALEAPAAVESLFLAEGSAADPDVSALVSQVHQVGARVFELAPGVLERVAATVTPQPVMAVVPMLHRPLEAVTGGRLVVVCADLRDPGNAGTVLRSADAAAADAVLWCGHAVDPYNPKAVRASAGSLFHVPLVVCDVVTDALRVAAELGYRRLGAVARGGEDYAEVDWSVPTALVLGNEARGLPAEVRAELDGQVTVPMAGRAESLNVGVACAILCFEALRQRRRPSGP